MDAKYPANRKIVAKQETNTDGTTNTSLEARFYSAPLPPPEMMAEYEKILPGSADRIIKRFEIQGDHRQKCERIFIRTQSIKSIGGLVSGFIIAITTILGGIYTALQGKPFLGGALSFTGLAVLVGAFIADKFIVHREKEEEE